MVKFSVLPTLLSWVIVFPYFLCVANHTGGNNRGVEHAELPSTSGAETPGTTRGKRSLIESEVKSTKSMDDHSSVKLETSMTANSKTESSRVELRSDEIATRLPPNDFPIRSNRASSLDTTGSDNSSRVIGKAVYSHNSTTGVLTLMDFNGPPISREGDDPAANSSHIRVKRSGFNHSGEKITDYFRGDDKSNVRNELDDIYPDLIDGSLRQRPSPGRVELVGRKTVGSDLTNYGNSAEENNGLAILETLSKYENSLDTLKRRKKRYASARDRKARKGGGGRHRKGKGAKSKHRRKHKKKHKKGKKGKGAAKAGKSHLVDDPRVEKREIRAGDSESEIEIAKRGISENDLIFRDKRTIDYGKSSDPSFNEHSSRVKQHRSFPGLAANEKSNEEPRPIATREKSRRSGFGNEDPRYYDDVHEPDTQPLDDIIERKSAHADETGKETAARSVQRIKELVEKLTGRVDELETYLNSGNNEERKIGGKKEADEEGSSNPARSVDPADFKNATKDDEARACAEVADASKSKLDVKKGGRGGEEDKEKTPELKRSTRILRRREASKKSRNKRKPHRKWDRWTDWSSCSVTCGKGRQIRWRHCTHDCTLAETEMEEKSCQLPACSPGKFLGIF